MTQEKKEELLRHGLEHLGVPVTDELKRFADSQLRGFLWRSKKEKRHIRQYMCSLCGESFETDDRYPDDIYNEFPINERLKHGDMISCPCCERDISVYDGWRPVNLHIPMFAEQWRKSVKDPNVLVAVGARVWTSYIEAWTTACPEIRVMSFAVIPYGRKGRRYVTDGTGYRAAYDMAHLDNGFVGARRVLDSESVGRAISGTPFERVCSEDMAYRITDHGTRSPLMRISTLSRCPQAEYMVKLGFTALVYEMLSRNIYSNLKGINWRGRSAEEVFGADMATIRALRHYGGTMTHSWYDAFRELSKAVPGWPVSMRAEYLDELALQYNIAYITEECGVRRYRLADELKYLKRQKARHSVLRWHDLSDYWRQCDELGVAADDYRTRHPKDLMDAHTVFGQRVKYMANQMHDDAICKLAAEYDLIYGCEADGLILRCAINSREVIDEGNALKHCVGSYVERYADGKTLIMLLRRADNPDKPFHTVEMTPGGRMIQCRGYRNQTGPEDRPLIDQFWADWSAIIAERRAA